MQCYEAVILLPLTVTSIFSACLDSANHSTNGLVHCQVHEQEAVGKAWCRSWQRSGKDKLDKLSV